MNTKSSMTIHDWLSNAQKELRVAHIPSARLDSLILLEDCLGRDRSSLLAHIDTLLKPSELQILATQLTRRRQHEPLAYIREQIEFYGRMFTIKPSVLVPRPESEQIIEALKLLSLPPAQRLADIGTGSGVLGITAALEFPSATVDLYDISPAALKVARENIVRHQLTLTTSTSDLLHNIRAAYDVLLVNLPYVPLFYPVDTAVSYEPTIALYAGDDGISIYRDFWRQVTQTRPLPRYIITEALASQHRALEKLAYQAGFRLHHTTELIQVFSRF